MYVRIELKLKPAIPMLIKFESIMKAMKIFRHEMFGDIRTMTNEKGETFFVGKDVAEALGYKNPQKALRDHVDEEDKTLNVSFTVNGTALHTTVRLVWTESGRKMVHDVYKAVKKIEMELDMLEFC